MRALHISALALVAALGLGGCSQQPPLQSAVPCIGLDGAACEARPEVAVAAPVPGQAVSHRSKSAAMLRHKRPRHHAAESRAAAQDQPLPAQPTPVAVAAKQAIPPAAPSAPGATVEVRVADAAALADRLTALSALPLPDAKDQPKDQPKEQPGAAARKDGAAAAAPSHLVAVVMVRPGVRAISELRGRSIAIDARYAAANNKVTSGLAAAGASDVQLMQGETTAINRLTNGEVPAAIVALVMPEAADAFPEIAGYKTFRVPLPAM